MAGHMSEERDIALIDELRQQPAETPWLEFKHNNESPEMIGKQVSALSNSARIARRECAYLIWGIEDGNHNVIGTDFSYETATVGNQGLQLWLAQQLNPSVAFSFRNISHPHGRIVLLEIPSPTNRPVEFKATAYIRIGGSATRLSDYPERFITQLIESMRPYTWETGLAKQFVMIDEVLELLDYESYLRLTELPEALDVSQVIDRLLADRLIERDVGGRWNITNLGAILFARDLTLFDSSLARKGVRFVAYDGSNRAATVTHRQDGRRGYANGFEGLATYINGLLPNNEHIGHAFRTTVPLFPSLAVRELIANALIHQDMTVSGAGPQIELFKDRMEITNPGQPLVSVERMIDLPPRSRNEAMAALMRRMGLCEEQGSGLDKVVQQAEIFQLPPPDFRVSDNTMQVIIYGPRSFANMTPDERVRACYQHATLKYLSGDKMRNTSLCERFGIEPGNAAQASVVIRRALDASIIKYADPEHPRAGYVPHWA